MRKGNNMSDLNPESQSPNPEAPVDPNPVDDGKGDKGDDDGKDWRTEFEGQRKVNRDLERKVKQQHRVLDQLAAGFASLRKGGEADDKKDDQPDPEEIRRQAKAEAAAEVLRDRALDKVETKAAKLFADPEDARALLASRVDEFVDDGKVDTDAIEEALADLLKKKPHLAAATAKRFQGSADGGARNGSGQPAQLTEQDLKRMTPQQIDKARLNGQLNDLLGIT